MAAVAALLAASSATAADLILSNGKVFTGDPGRPYAQAVAIENGRIKAVGDATVIARLATPRTRVVDVGGRLVVPGLVEAHGHTGPEWTGREAAMPNLPWPGPTSDEALAAVREAAKAGPGLITGAIGPLVVDDRRDWRAALDAAAPDNPVVLGAWWGHSTLANSRGLQTLGVADRAADPMGGWYGRRPDGSIDGRLRESAEWTPLRRELSTVPAPAAARAYAQTAREYVGWGVTSYHLMAVGQSLEATLAALGAARTPIKWSVYAWAAPTARMEDAWREFGRSAPPAGKVRIAGLKWVVDGTPIERDAWMRRPYADRPGWSGRANYTPAELRTLMRQALRRPQPVALHAVGDAQIAALFTLMEQAAPAAAWRRKRVRLEHADGLAPDLVARAAWLGVVIVQNPLHLDFMPNAAGVPMITARWGAAVPYQPLKSLLRAGVPLALGSDAGGPAANPFLNIMLATVHPSRPAEALTREEALLAYTSGGAYAEGLEREKGRLAPGMAADLAVLSQDILTVPTDALPGTRSLLTLVDGAVAHAEAPFTQAATGPPSVTQQGDARRASQP